MNRSFMFLMHRPRPIGLIDAVDISGNEEAQLIDCIHRMHLMPSRYPFNSPNKSFHVV